MSEGGLFQAIQKLRTAAARDSHLARRFAASPSEALSGAILTSEEKGVLSRLTREQFQQALGVPEALQFNPLGAGLRTSPARDQYVQRRLFLPTAAGGTRVVTSMVRKGTPFPMLSAFDPVVASALSAGSCSAGGHCGTSLRITMGPGTMGPSTMAPGTISGSHALFAIAPTIMFAGLNGQGYEDAYYTNGATTFIIVPSFAPINFGPLPDGTARSILMGDLSICAYDLVAMGTGTPTVMPVLNIPARGQGLPSVLIPNLLAYIADQNSGDTSAINAEFVVLNITQSPNPPTCGTPPTNASMPGVL